MNRQIRTALPRRERRMSLSEALEPRLLLANFVVTTTAQSGPGSLRQAILNSNLDAGLDTITFNIPTLLPARINVSSSNRLPDLIYPAIIDATTQPGYSGAPLIELVGIGSLDGLVIAGTGTAVRGVALGGFNTAILATSDVTVQSCWIGIDASGNSIPNGRGIYCVTPQSMIGGITPQTRNVIGNNSIGIILEAGVIQGNYVGISPTGSTAPNRIGVWAAGSSTIGGTVAGARNIISGNQTGIHVGGVSGSAYNSTLIQGNYIGTDPTGLSAIANAVGISSSDPGQTIGGTVAAARNVVSGNSGAGIALYAGGDPVVQGNYIGLGADGITPLGNGGNGIELHSGQHIIGGQEPGAGNVIAHNLGKGVIVSNTPGTAQNSIRGNTIYANAGLAIDLGNDGPTPNDLNDLDTGPNLLQNYPVITFTGTDGSTTRVAGTLNSSANSAFTLDFYATSPDNSGQIYLGYISVATDAAGNASFSTTFSSSVTPGWLISATATAVDGSTSEFSSALWLPAPGDTNRDRSVDFFDLTALSASYGQSDRTWADGDFNGDRIVNFFDLTTLAAHYGDKLASPASVPATPSMSAPNSDAPAPEAPVPAAPVLDANAVTAPVPTTPHTSAFSAVTPAPTEQPMSPADPSAPPVTSLMSPAAVPSTDKPSFFHSEAKSARSLFATKPVIKSVARSGPDRQSLSHPFLICPGPHQATMPLLVAPSESRLKLSEESEWPTAGPLANDQRIANSRRSSRSNRAFSSARWTI